MRIRRLIPLGALLLAVSGAQANTSHAGWPTIDGMLLMNKHDESRPLDGRPGHDPFDGTQVSLPCDGQFRNTQCVPDGIAVPATLYGVPCTTVAQIDRTIGRPLDPGCANQPRLVTVVPDSIGHNELLGGHGNDTIHAGPAGDVLWGDYKPSGQPSTQEDFLYGGPGNDFIYASHGTNHIWTGGGRDMVHAHFGRGEIHCDSNSVTVYLSRASRRHYRLFGCRHLSYRTLGY